MTLPPLLPVADGGDRLLTLRALRNRLAEELDLATRAQDVVQLARQLADVMEQIDQLNADRMEDEGDDFADLLALPGAG